MEKKEFLDVSREYFKSIGFQTLKKSKFYYDSKDLILQVYLTHSNFCESFYIDYYVGIKDLNPALNISNFESHIDAQGRFGEGQYQVEIEYEKITLNKYVEILEKQTKIHIRPIINNSLKAILTLPNIFIYKQHVIDYLKKYK